MTNPVGSYGSKSLGEALIRDELGKGPDEELSLSEWVRGGISAYLNYSLQGQALKRLVEGVSLSGGCKPDNQVIDQDQDDDGYTETDGDCDDHNNTIHPDAAEDSVCDGLDSNCDGNVDDDLKSTWNIDYDGDGYGSDAHTIQACEGPSGYTLDGTDCDDMDPTAYPGAFDICDETDNNCDGTIDEGVTSTFYHDADGDGQGDVASAVEACVLSAGTVADSRDCDDNNNRIYAGAYELCNGVDDDCDGSTDEAGAVDMSKWYADSDGDGFGDPGLGVQACQQPAGYVADSTDCDDSKGAINSDGSEICDGEDNDCDGTIDEDDAADAKTWYVDSDNDSYGDVASSLLSCESPADFFVTDGTDCDDDSVATYPGAPEICDLEDNNCNGTVDEGVKTTYYRDSDTDGYGNPLATTAACMAPTGYVANSQDCNDAEATAHTGAEEVCDAANVDEDCDGLTDNRDTALGKSPYYEDADGDGYGTPLVSATDFCDAPTGYFLTNDDCDDTNPALNPANPDDCGVPVPIFPPDGTTLTPTRAYLSWDETPWASKTVNAYEVCYADLALSLSGSCLLFTTSADETYNTAAVIDPLEKNETYAWQVRAAYTDGTVSAFSSAYTFVTDDSIVGWWKFDNGTADDSSGNSHNGTFVNGAMVSSTGGLDGALDLDGGDDYVEVPFNSVWNFGGDPFTIEVRAWMNNQYDVEEHYGLVCRQTVENYGYGGWWLQLRSCCGTVDQLWFDGDYSAGVLYLGADIPGGFDAQTWHHYAFTTDPSPLVEEARMYYDAALLGTFIHNRVIQDVNVHLYLGAFYTPEEGIKEPFNGLFDEVVIYNKALSDDEVTNNYCAIETLVLGAEAMLPAVCP